MSDLENPPDSTQDKVAPSPILIGLVAFTFVLALIAAIFFVLEEFKVRAIDTLTEVGFYFSWIVVVFLLLIILLAVLGVFDSEPPPSNVRPLDSAGPDPAMERDRLEKLKQDNDKLTKKNAALQADLDQKTKLLDDAKSNNNDAEVAKMREELQKLRLWKEQDAKSDEETAKELADWKRKATLFEYRQEMVESARKRLAESKPWFGVRIMETPKPGVVCEDVKDGGPAHRAGLRDGDLIEQLNGKEENDAETFKKMIVSSFKPGDVVSLLVHRGSKYTVISMEIGTKGMSHEELAKVHRHADGIVSDAELQAYVKSKS